MNGVRKLGLAFVGLVALAAALLYLRSQTGRPAPSAPGYYIGPMVNKAGQMVDDDGKVHGPAKSR